MKVKKPITLALLVAILVLAAGRSGAQDRIRYNNQNLFLSGANLAWQYFADDIGPDPSTPDTNHFDDVFSQIRANGGNTLRLWLHTNLGIGRPLLWAVAAWIVTQALVRIPFLLLNGLSLVRFQTVLFAIATSIALALKFVLAKPLGVPGILWATSVVVLLIVFPASLWRLWHWARHPGEKQTLTQPPPAEEPAGHLP